jgi:RHS repeat-associated protein
MTKSYYYVDGEMIGYSDANGHKDVLTDALGNITAEVDQFSNVTHQARYTPLGSTLSSSGISTSGFGWLGAHGYRETGLAHASHYVRERHYSDVSGAWTTVDSIWPSEPAYGYVGGRATVDIDPSGSAPCSDDGCKDCTCEKMRLTIPPQYREKASFTICCKSGCTPCIGKRDGEKSGSVSYKCQVAHENRHCEDLKNKKNTVFCNGNPCGGVSNTNVGSAECPAMMRTITCNWNGMNKKPCADPNSWECTDIKNACLYISGKKDYPPGSGKFFKCSPIPSDIKTICKKVGINV